MFATFPIFGITQGFLPIAGYNYGAKNWKRVRKVINISIVYAVALATVVLLFILFFADQIPTLFSKDAVVNAQTPAALKYVFAALPVVGIQLIGAAYFQAVGKALPALLLTLSRQGLILFHYYLSCHIITESLEFG